MSKYNPSDEVSDQVLLANFDQFTMKKHKCHDGFSWRYPGMLKQAEWHNRIQTALQHCRNGIMVILDDAGTLSWPNLECCQL